MNMKLTYLRTQTIDWLNGVVELWAECHRRFRREIGSMMIVKMTIPIRRR